MYIVHVIVIGLWSQIKRPRRPIHNLHRLDFYPLQLLVGSPTILGSRLESFESMTDSTPFHGRSWKRICASLLVPRSGTGARVLSLARPVPVCISVAALGVFFFRQPPVV